MKSRFLTITLAALLAVFGVVAVLAYVHQANERAVNGLRADTVYYANRLIPAGTSLQEALQENWLKTEKVPVSSLSVSSPSTAPVRVGSTDKLHLVMSADVAKGLVLLANMLGKTAAPVASGIAIPIPIPNDMQAIAVQMCVSEAVAGYLTPGSEVTVYQTFPTSPNVDLQRTCNVGHTALAKGLAKTEVVAGLQRVLVLSVTQGSAASQGTSSAASSVVADPASSTLSTGAVSVTFAVTQAQALDLIQAAQVEMPYLGLLPSTH